MLMTPRVATYYATFLNFLVDNLNVDPKDMHLIGHSLGAHISGFAGRQVRTGKVGRITGKRFYSLSKCVFEEGVKKISRNKGRQT